MWGGGELSETQEEHVEKMIEALVRTLNCGESFRSKRNKPLLCTM